MSKQIVANYSFNAAARTVTLTDFNGSRPVLLERLALITDTTTNKVLYNFADSTLSTAAISSNNVITLSALQGGEANGDKLRIDYDTVPGDPEYSASATINSTGLALDATLTGGTQQTKLTDGTNVAHVLKSDGTAAGQNSQMIAGSHLTVPFSTTTAQAVATTDAANYAWVSVHIASQGTSSSITFQCSNDNVNWVSHTMQGGSATASSGFSSTASALLAYAPLNARYFRLNVTGISAGTTAGVIEFFTQPKAALSTGVGAAQSGTWTVQPGNTANTTPWLVTSTDGTNSANVLKSDGTAAGQNAQMVAGNHLAVPFSTTTAQAVATTDGANYRFASVQITSQGTSSTVNFQMSNDNTNWVSCILFPSSSTQQAGNANTTTTGIFAASLQARYFRLNVTGISAGTTAGVVEFFSVAPPTHSISGTVSQGGTWTVQPGNTANTTAWKVDGSSVTQPINMTQVAGTAASVNAGTNDAGTQRVAQAVASTLYNGKKTVTTAGTRVALASSQVLTQGVTIKALIANAGTIYVGDSTVAASNGFALSAGETVTLPVSNLSTVFIDAAVSGEGVTYIGV